MPIGLETLLCGQILWHRSEVEGHRDLHDDV
jgi:hypothetical protein